MSGNREPNEMLSGAFGWAELRLAWDLTNLLHSYKAEMRLSDKTLKKGALRGHAWGPFSNWGWWLTLEKVHERKGRKLKECSAQRRNTSLWSWRGPSSSPSEVNLLVTFQKSLNLLPASIYLLLPQSEQSTLF